MAKDCRVVTHLVDTKEYHGIFVDFGMESIYDIVKPHEDDIRVMLDGRVVGSVKKEDAGDFVAKLRLLKLDNKEISKYTEICHIPQVDRAGGAGSDFQGGQYPAIFIFTSPNRLMRRVVNLRKKQIELIGVFEQMYLHVAVSPDEIVGGLTTHVELSLTSFLSPLASLIPLLNYNPSSRNATQCEVCTI
jgi:DNA-directed RNA polymerase I subunit RPA2